MKVEAVRNMKVTFVVEVKNGSEALIESKLRNTLGKFFEMYGDQVCWKKFGKLRLIVTRFVPGARHNPVKLSSGTIQAPTGIFLKISTLEDGDGMAAECVLYADFRGNELRELIEVGPRKNEALLEARRKLRDKEKQLEICHAESKKLLDARERIQRKESELATMVTVLDEEIAALENEIASVFEKELSQQETATTP